MSYDKVRTRYAPSPTGFMHIGNLRTALYEYLIAKSQKGDFVLRIEDTDQERKVEGAVDFIYNTLGLCNFKIDEGPNNPGKYGPYVQSERKDIPRYGDPCGHYKNNPQARRRDCQSTRVSDPPSKACR